MSARTLKSKLLQRWQANSDGSQDPEERRQLVRVCELCRPEEAKCIGANKAAAEQVKRVIEAKLALGDLGFLQDAQAAEEKKTTFHQYANDWVVYTPEDTCTRCNLA